MDLRRSAVKPFCVVFLGLDELGDELGADRKEDEAVTVETAVDVSAETDTVGDVRRVADVGVDVVHGHVVLSEPRCLIFGHQVRIITRALCDTGEWVLFQRGGSYLA